MASEEDRPARARLYWVDWLRTQCVWNVVCGHVWWSVRDATGLNVLNVYQAPWTEGARMLEYTVAQGAFHTIPLFFLVSGLLAARSLGALDGGGRALRRFVANRALRLGPPFAVGLVSLVSLPPPP